jgi:hypothetical protein
LRPRPTVREVKVEALEFDVEGIIDLNGFFGLKPIRPGLFDVKLASRIQSDADASVLQKVLGAARSLSPIFNSVTTPVGVEATVMRA